jgi:hypothetical protein
MLERYFKKRKDLWLLIALFLGQHSDVERGIYPGTTDEDSDGIIPNEDEPSERFRAYRLSDKETSSLYIIWFEVKERCYCVTFFSGGIIALEEVVYSSDHWSCELVPNTEHIFTSAVKFIAHFMENIAK